LAEVGELYQHTMDMDHVENVMKAVVLKDNKSHGFIRERGDPIKAIWAYRRDHTMAEIWYEYYWREKWYADLYNDISYFDAKGTTFDPLYVHH